MNNCNNNLKKAIWFLDCKRMQCDAIITLDKVFEMVVNLILNIRKSKNVIKIFDDEIRTNIYNILITNIKGSEIITILMDSLILKIDNDEINARIIQYASEAENNLVHGRRDIIHIDYFVSSVMKILIKYKI